MAVKKYVWVKLKEDFFEDETIAFIEEQENGILYSNFYLKLCLKSLKFKGRLMRLVGDTYMPYDHKALSRLTGVDINVVMVAMQLFESIGLLQKLDTGEIYLNQLEEMIGTETDKAEIMRKKRANDKLLGSGNNVTQVLPPVTEEFQDVIEVVPESYSDVPKSYTDIRDKNIDIRDKNKKNKKTSSSSSSSKTLKHSQETYNEFKEIYNEHCPNLKGCRSLDKGRCKGIDEFLDNFTKEDFVEICKNANKSQWHTGKNERGWKANFDFILKIDKARNFLEFEETEQNPERAPSYDINEFVRLNIFGLEDEVE